MIYELNGESYDIPHGWQVLKTKTYQKIVTWDFGKDLAERDYFKLFCIMAEKDYDSFVANDSNEIDIWNAIRWILETPMPKDMPKALEVGDKLVSIPKQPLLSSIGQHIHIRKEIEQAKVMEEKLAISAAIWLQPLIDESKFDYLRAKELEEVIGEMPVNLIYPIGFFLLMQVLRDGQTSKKKWNLTKTNLRTRLMRLLRGLRILQN